VRADEVAPPATSTRAHCALRMGVAVERPAVVWTVEPGAKPSTKCAHTNDMNRLDVGSTRRQMGERRGAGRQVACGCSKGTPRLA